MDSQPIWLDSANALRHSAESLFRVATYQEGSIARLGAAVDRPAVSNTMIGPHAVAETIRQAFTLAAYAIATVSQQMSLTRGEALTLIDVLQQGLLEVDFNMTDDEKHFLAICDSIIAGGSYEGKIFDALKQLDLFSALHARLCTTAIKEQSA